MTQRCVPQGRRCTAVRVRAAWRCGCKCIEGGGVGRHLRSVQNKPGRCPVPKHDRARRSRDIAAAAPFTAPCVLTALLRYLRPLARVRSDPGADLAGALRSHARSRRIHSPHVHTITLTRSYLITATRCAATNTRRACLTGHAITTSLKACRWLQAVSPPRTASTHGHRQPLLPLTANKSDTPRRLGRAHDVHAYCTLPHVIRGNHRWAVSYSQPQRLHSPSLIRKLSSLQQQHPLATHSAALERSRHSCAS